MKVRKSGREQERWRKERIWNKLVHGGKGEKDRLKEKIIKMRERKEVGRISEISKMKKKGRNIESACTWKKGRE